MVCRWRNGAEAMCLKLTAFGCECGKDSGQIERLATRGDLYKSVAFGEDRKKFSSAESFCRYASIAPVTERSGKKEWVHWRYSCPRFLRHTFVEWANESIRFSFWAKAFYLLQRERGKTHQMAVRSLAFKWVRILYRCWQEWKPYDEAKYLMALKAMGSTLVSELAK